jgi:predicted O-methyltransferase YrrM
MALIHQMREDSTQRQGLVDLCNSVKYYLGDNGLQLVEVGSYCGESGGIIASTFPNSILNCVDPWEKYTEEGSTYDLNEQELILKEAERIFDSTTGTFPNVRKNKMPSIKYAESLESNSIDFIYIDGNHQYSSVIEDLTMWHEKVKVGGVIAGHDFGWASVSRAIYEFFDRPPVSVFGDGSWFYFKK